MDYVIIGGGIYGCGVAWELARRGAEVLLLEANKIASGASGGLGKRGVRANGRDLRELPLMSLAYERWPFLHKELDGPTGYERCGHLWLVEREQDLDRAAAMTWMQGQNGIPSRLIDGAELREMESLVSEQIRQAVYCPNDGVADHTETTHSYASAAKSLGAEIREETALLKIESDGEQVTAVVTAEQERIPVDKALILLANSQVPRMLQSAFDLSLPIWQWYPQVMLTEIVDPLPTQHLIGHAHRTLAIKPNYSDVGNQVMISGGWRGKRASRAGEHPFDIQRGETQPDQIVGNLAEAVAVYPSLAGIGVQEANAARLESFSVDGIPIIDTAPRVNNLFYGTGWSGHGWAIAPSVTRLIADWVWTGEHPELLKPFAYTRFSQRLR